MKEIIIQVAIEINAPISKVWEALVTPSIIKEYMFGTETTSDWKVGSRISYKGVWEGKEYEDGGIITEFVENKVFESTYFSSMSGEEDKEENYS
ncbi:MAG: SRPBCC domain-containing protein, partial [Candidatus Kapabacteria bacterium]|nr:SRPBCC domain-containing protein [Candidatus Kapabacteria bacterium]